VCHTTPTSLPQADRDLTSLDKPSGSLPEGLSLAAKTRVISGTPTQAGTENFAVTVQDSETTPVTSGASLALTVTAATPTVIPRVNPSSIAPGQSSTITAVVNGASGEPVPTGTVQFKSNGANLGAPISLASGTATLSSQVFPIAGSFAISADYSGDAVYSAVNSAGVTLTVITQGGATLTANPSTMRIIAPANSGTTTLTISGFSSQSIEFSCAGLPPGASCDFGTLSNNGNSETAPLHIITDMPSNANLEHTVNHGTSTVMRALTLPGLFAIAGIFMTRRKYHEWQRLFTLAFALCMGLVVSGCGVSARNITTSTITVSAKSGTQSAATTITLIVEGNLEKAPH
jgi:Bacterial Ig-like domain (group 3)/Putative Ig domain